MAGLGEIEVVVFDVLGTLVDEPGGLRAALGDDDLVALWQRHVETEQQRIFAGQRAYANSEVLDREAAGLVAEHAGISDPAEVARLATAGQRLPAWPDSAAGLDQLARRFPVVGLSNAGRAALLRLAAHAGLRWHQALSGETAQAYKPAPEVYRLAIDATGCPPERLLLVAAHAWDLRGAQAAGFRTAYVERPGGDPPADGDAFDGAFSDLDELIRAL